MSDPYRKCEETCTHDLARGVMVADLCSRDGPEEPMIWAPIPAAAAVLTRLVTVAST